MKLLAIIFTFSISHLLMAQTKVAIVSMIRGEALVVENGKEISLAKDVWVNSGSVVKTKEKSFVKLVFIDKSQMNVGPNSEMKIEQFGGNEAGVIDLVKGKIRSQVSKDYLQQQDKSKSKIFVKTPNAVMGIRGTDFLISTNGINTAAVLFEGNVVFNQLPNDVAGSQVSTDRLEQIVDQGQRIMPDEFSSVMGAQAPTIPAKMNVHQIENLQKNENFTDAPATDANSAESKNAKSIVPPGLTGSAVGNDPESLKSEVKQVVDSGSSTPSEDKSSPEGAPKDSAGFVDGDKVKPADGSFVDINSGVVIPPAADSVFDKTTNTYIASTNSGTVDDNGNYVPPKGIEITPEGQVLVVNTAADGTVVKKEVQMNKVMDTAPHVDTKVNKPMPGQMQTPAGGQFGSTAPVASANPIPGMPLNNDILNANFTPGGLNDLGNFRNNTSGSLTPTSAVQQSSTTDVTISVKP